MPWSERLQGEEPGTQVGLASPFLDEESFVGESIPEWGPGAAALVNESPYARALEWSSSPSPESAVATTISDRAEASEEMQPSESWREHALEPEEVHPGRLELVQQSGYAEEEVEDLVSFEAGDLPALFEIETLPKVSLRGTQRESATLRSLGDVLEEFLQARKSAYSEKGVCVAASLRHFTEACKKAGVAGQQVGDYEIPRIVTRSGAPLRVGAFLVLWFSNVKAKGWNRLPQVCRGAGAPGALLYADLVAGRKLLTSRSGWPEGLKAGAVLQTWSSAEAFGSVRSGGPGEGHSCIFRGYVSGRPDLIEVADQRGLRKPLRWGGRYTRYVIAANLSGFEFVADKRSEVEPRELLLAAETLAEPMSLSGPEDTEDRLEDINEGAEQVEEVSGESSEGLQQRHPESPAREASPVELMAEALDLQPFYEGDGEDFSHEELDGERTSPQDEQLARLASELLDEAGHAGPSFEEFAIKWSRIAQATSDIKYVTTEDGFHETLTAQAAKKAGVSSEKEVEKLLIGCIWPDVPCKNDNEIGVSYPGLVAARIRKANLQKEETELKKRGRTLNSLPIAYRSHFGDLQFWHSMARSGEVTNSTVRKKILTQIFRWYTKGLRIWQMSPDDLKRGRMRKEDGLFYLGRALHTIQDSFCRSHTWRARGTEAPARKGDPRPKREEILSFQDYELQDSGLHWRADIWSADEWAKVGWGNAIEASVNMIRWFVQGKPCKGDVWNYLCNKVFPLAPGYSGKLAGACEGAYVRKPAKEIRNEHGQFDFE